MKALQPPLMASQGHLGILNMDLWQRCSWSQAWDASFNLLPSCVKRSQYVYHQTSMWRRKVEYRQTDWKEWLLKKEASIRVTIVPGKQTLSQKMERSRDRGHVGNGQEKSVPFLSGSHSKRGRGGVRWDSTLVIATQSCVARRSLFSFVAFVCMSCICTFGFVFVCLTFQKGGGRIPPL